MRRSLPLLTILSLIPLAAIGQTTSSWVGQRVITHDGAVLKVGNQVVDDEKRSTNLAVSGHDRSRFRVYRVGQVNGNWLWLKAEKEGVEGWVKVESVIPFSQAIDYFTGQIGANPSQAEWYSRRASVWHKRGEYDIAIADYNEAIRLKPSDEMAWNNRGYAWWAKKEYDKAIADYNEALRLDPKFAMAYNNRGNAWWTKKEYDKTIADYDEALRLDPKNALAYYNRGITWMAKKEYDKAIADYNEALRFDPRLAGAYNDRAWLRATCPDDRYRDGPKALTDASQASQLNNDKETEFLGTLAAAYAECGDFAKAVECQEKANKLYTDAEDRKKGEERLKLYQEKTPYRDTE